MSEVRSIPNLKLAQKAVEIVIRGKPEVTDNIMNIIRDELERQAIVTASVKCGEEDYELGVVGLPNKPAWNGLVYLIEENEPLVMKDFMNRLYNGGIWNFISYMKEAFAEWRPTYNEEANLYLIWSTPTQLATMGMSKEDLVK